ncbi:MAG: hypothetical protein EA377_05450 [Phycisphaerales bacterium]|nr:MAG: hypothetical protein EA377_05450 [Phycisphaerales bacterium]
MEGGLQYVDSVVRRSERSDRSRTTLVAGFAFAGRVIDCAWAFAAVTELDPGRFPGFRPNSRLGL